MIQCDLFTSLCSSFLRLLAMLGFISGLARPSPSPASSEATGNRGDEDWGLWWCQRMPKFFFWEDVKRFCFKWLHEKPSLVVFDWFEVDFSVIVPTIRYLQTNKSHIRSGSKPIGWEEIRLWRGFLGFIGGHLGLNQLFGFIFVVDVVFASWNWKRLGPPHCFFPSWLESTSSKLLELLELLLLLQNDWFWQGKSKSNSATRVVKAVRKAQARLLFFGLHREFLKVSVCGSGSKKDT